MYSGMFFIDSQCTFILDLNVDIVVALLRFGKTFVPLHNHNSVWYEESNGLMTALFADYRRWFQHIGSILTSEMTRVLVPR